MSIARCSLWISTSVTLPPNSPSTVHETGSSNSKRSAPVYPWLIAEEEGKILAYAYAHRAQERAAYDWNAELSVYVSKNAAGRGLGTRLYRALLALLKEQGVRTAYGVVTMPNDASAALHRKLGFGLLGTYHNTGYKNGRWRDVVWFEKHIGSFNGVPEPIRPIGQLADREAVLRTI